MEEKYNEDLINKYASHIVNSSLFNEEKKYIQHGNTTTYAHSISVAKEAVRFANKYHLKLDYKSLIVGSLLHDYYLYDWHVKEKWHRFHGFKHARFAYLNASKDYGLNNIESNMIKSHMFPLGFRIPLYKESLVLWIADKKCTLKETFRKD